MVAFTPVITDITSVLTFHITNAIRCISDVRSLCCDVFSCSLLITLICHEIEVSTSRHVCLFQYNGWCQVIIITIILVITSVHGIYNYVPDTNRFSRLYSVAAVLYLQCVLHVMLFRPWNMFCTFTLALPAVCMHCPMWLFFCSSLISCFPMLCLGIFLVTLKWFQSPPLLPVSLLLSHSTCAEFLLIGLFILESSQLLS